MSNCFLSAGGHGDYEVTVTTISHGISIAAGAPDQARNHRAYYFSRRTSGSFTLGLVFTSQKAYGDFGAWLQAYGSKVSAPGVKVGAMRVSIPSREFERVAVPVSGTTYGEQVGQVSYPMSLRFDGGRDSEDFSSPAISQFVAPIFNQEESAFFYPGGTQLSGAGSKEDALYGLPFGTTKVMNVIKNLFGGGGSDQAPMQMNARRPGSA